MPFVKSLCNRALPHSCPETNRALVRNPFFTNEGLYCSSNHALLCLEIRFVQYLN